MDVQTRVETRTYGTITHMAPEVLRSNQISKAADVYSFGVILWELAAGCRAWVGARLPPPSALSLKLEKSDFSNTLGVMLGRDMDRECVRV